jgi:hypothetical protein
MKSAVCIILSKCVYSAGFFLIASFGINAHANDKCAAVKASVNEAGFSDSVSVICSDSHAHIVSDTYPDHELMTGIVGSNEQIPVPAHEHSAPIPLNVALGTTPQTRDAALGVAVNGVPIYDYTAGGEMSIDDLHHHQTRHDTLLTQQLDHCGGHAGRGDDYHYHVKPVCMIEQMKNKDDDAIIGWAFDGFPIYGDNSPDGSIIGSNALDVCNGQVDSTFGYRYHTSENAPYIVQCLMGVVDDFKNLPRVPPLKPASGEKKLTTGRPPQGGVDNLVFIDDGAGLRRMEYSYEGKHYYISYSNSDESNCYNFETKTVTNNGEVMSTVLCR